MTYRIYLYEDGSKYPCLVWEMDDGIVAQHKLENAARLSAHMRRMLYLSAGAEDVERCAADAVGGKQPRLRVTVLSPQSHATPGEVQALIKRVEFLEAQVRSYRDVNRDLSKESLRLEAAAAEAEGRATQAELDARMARENADKRVANANENERDAWDKKNEAETELRAAKAEVRRLKEELEDANA